MEELKELVDGLKNALFVAYNAIPVEHVETGIPSSEVLEKTSAIIVNAQAKMITLECLQAAVKTECDEKTRKKVSKKTLELIDAYEKYAKEAH